VLVLALVLVLLLSWCWLILVQPLALRWRCGAALLPRLWPGRRLGRCWSLRLPRLYRHCLLLLCGWQPPLLGRRL
jgi:hypothetical protein